MKKIYSILILLIVVIFSISIMILPTFFTNNVSRVSIDKEFDLPLILNDEKDIKIVFFGYSGCINICTPRLQDINKLYSSLDTNIKNRVGVEFIDISSPANSELPSQFAKSFNNDFKGIYLRRHILREYTKEFNVYFAKSLLDEYEYDHTSNLYIVKKNNRRKSIRFVYNSYPYDFTQINSDILELVNE